MSNFFINFILSIIGHSKKKNLSALFLQQRLKMHLSEPFNTQNLTLSTIILKIFETNSSLYVK